MSTRASVSLSPKKVALSLGVSESSLKRWCDQGFLPSVRTPGGHRRLPVEGVIRFVRTHGHRLKRPELLGLPIPAVAAEASPLKAVDGLLEALVAADFDNARRLLLGLFLAGTSTARLADELLAPVLTRIGHGWRCGKIEVFEEHRAVELVTRVLHELRGLLPAPEIDAQRAVGGSVEGDVYGLPTLLLELALTERGYNASSLGTSLPFATLHEAVRKLKPKLVWLSVSVISDEDRLVEGVNRLFDKLPEKTTLVVGGRALTRQTRLRMRYSAYCDTLAQLVAFDNALTCHPSRSGNASKHLDGAN